MMLLPKTVGPFTLIRKLGTGGVAESYHGILDEQGSQKVVVRRILPYILQDSSRMASTEARVRDLLGVRHPFLVRVLDWVADGQDRFIVEDWIDGVSLAQLLRYCRDTSTTLPHNVYLNLATQICNGLEALHGRPGKGTGSQCVLHLSLKPTAIQVTREGKVVLGSYGLSRSPTALSQGGMLNPVPVRVEYLSPEQTHPDQKLSPASDIFSLGAFLYEMLTLEPLFRSDSNLLTIDRIRRVEITRQLLKVKAIMPGLDKVLYRALSLNPRHRYQRAFVLREDLRGLMAGYSFSTIVDDTRDFIGQIIDSQSGPQSGISGDEPQAGAGSGLEALQSSAKNHHTAPPDVSDGFVPNAAPEDTLAAERDDDVLLEGPPVEPIGRTEPPPNEEAAPPSPVQPAEELQAHVSHAAPDISADLPDNPELPSEQITAIRPSPFAQESVDGPTDEPAFDPGSADSEIELPIPILATDEVFDPNSTAGFLRGHQPRSPRPPSLQPRQPPRFAEAPHDVPTPQAVPPRQSTRAPQPVPPRQAPRAPQPVPPRQAPPQSLTRRAPPPAALPPAPSVEELDLDPPRTERLPLLVLGAAAIVLLVCGGAGAAVFSTLGSLGTDAPEIAVPSTAHSVNAEAEKGHEAAAPRVSAPAAEPLAPDADPVAAAGDNPPTAAAPERPRTVPETTASAARSEPAAEPRPAAAAASSTSSRSAASERLSAPRSSEADEDGFAFLDEPDGGDQGDPIQAAPVDLDRYATSAASGGLNRSDILALETVGISDEDYTRSRALLLMNAQRTSNERATQQYLEELMRKPENQYNPVYLTDSARFHANRGSYRRALEHADLAERHWQRLPSDLIFVKKAEIYEIQAAAYQGLFYDSDSDTDLLLKSIRHWEKVSEHVKGRDSSRQRRADSELEKLQDIRQRLEN